MDIMDLKCGIIMMIICICYVWQLVCDKIEGEGGRDDVIVVKAAPDSGAT